MIYSCYDSVIHIGCLCKACRAWFLLQTFLGGTLNIFHHKNFKTNMCNFFCRNIYDLFQRLFLPVTFCFVILQIRYLDMKMSSTGVLIFPSHVVLSCNVQSSETYFSTQQTVVVGYLCSWHHTYRVEPKKSYFH